MGSAHKGSIHKMKAKLKKMKEDWCVIFRFFREYNDRKVIVLIAVSVLIALEGVGITYLLSHIVNLAVGGSWGISREMAVMSGILVLAYALNVLLGVLRNALTRAVAADSTERIQEEAILFAGTDDYLHFISKEQNDKHLFVMDVSNSANRAILNGAMEAVQGTVAVIGGIGILFAISGWWSVIMAVFIVATCLYVENNNGRKLLELFGNTIPDNRRMAYYADVLTGCGTAYEKALFGYSGRIHGRMEEANREIVGRKRKATAEVTRNTSSFRILYSLVYFGFVLCVFLSGGIRDAGTVYLAFSMARTVVLSAASIGSSLSNVYTRSMYIQRFNDYLKKDVQAEGDRRPSGREGIARQGQDDVVTVEDLTFRYYGHDPVLKHVTFSIPKGETVAIVGENGAGKTSLVNVLLGLLDSKGSVLVNGVDPYEDLKRQGTESRIVSVMQSFGRYNGISLRDNITFGKELPGDVREKAAAILGNGEDLDSLLGKTMGNEFGGIGLSGGQWQKLALLRAQMGQGIIVLDEPTASLDPLSEVAVLRDFMTERQEGLTKLIVTHRLGCTKYADRILVLDQGTIVEDGSFEELLDRKGKYYDMYTAQAELYQVS